MATVNLNAINVPLTGNSRSFNRAAKSAAQAARRLEQRQRRLRNEMRRMSFAARGYVRSMVSIRSVLGSVVGTAGLGLFVSNTARAGAELLNFAESAGFGVEALQALQRAGGDYNIEARTIDQGLVRFSRVIGEANQGLATYTRIFDELGVSITNADGSLRSTEDVFVDFTSALQNVGSASQRNALLMQAFGRQGARLGQLFDRVGAQGFKRFIENQKEAGILTKEQTENLRSLNREFNNLGDIFTFESRGFVEGLADEWEELVKIAQRGLPKAFDFAGDATETVLLPVLREIASNIDGVVTAIGSLVIALSKLPALAATIGATFASKFTVGFAKARAATRGFMRDLVWLRRRGLALNATNDGLYGQPGPPNLRAATSTFNRAMMREGNFDKYVRRVNRALKLQGDEVVRMQLRFVSVRNSVKMYFEMLGRLIKRKLTLNRTLRRTSRRLGDMYAVWQKAGKRGTSFSRTAIVARGTVAALGGALKGLWGIVRIGLRILKPFAAFFVKFLVISTVINLIIDFQATIDRLVRFFWALVDVIKELPGMVYRALKAMTPFGTADEIINDDISKKFSHLATTLKDVALASDDAVAGINKIADLGRHQRLLEIDQRFENARAGVARLAASRAARNRPVSTGPTSDDTVFSFQYAEVVRKQGEAMRKIVAEGAKLQIDAMFAAQRAGIARLSEFRNRPPVAGIGAFGGQTGPQMAADVRGQGFARRAEEEQKRLEEQMKRNQQIIDSMRGGFEKLFESIIDGTAKASDAFKALTNEIARAVLRATVIQPIAESISSGIGSFFPIPGRAAGGPVTRGNPYIVGERGAELFVPQSSGRIVANKDMMGGKSMVFNFNIESTDGPGVKRALDEAFPVFVQAAVDANQESQDRPGDLYE